MAKQHGPTNRSVLKVKLGRPFEMTQEALFRLLERVRNDCCKARNAAMTEWVLFRRRNPNWKPEDPFEGPALKIKRKKKGKEQDKPKKPCPIAPDAFLNRTLYNVAREAARSLDTQLAVVCRNDVNSQLRHRVPYDHGGKAQYVWEAILASEIGIPSWKMGVIPVPNRSTNIGYNGVTIPPIMCKEKDGTPILDEKGCVKYSSLPGSEDVRLASCSAAVIRVSLLSKESGNKVRAPMIRLEVGKMKNSQKRILRRIASGEIKLADSKLVEKDGEWFVHLSYECGFKAADCDKARVLTVTPASPDNPRPFVLRWKDSDGQDYTWDIGNGKPLTNEYRRIQARRMALRSRPKQSKAKGRRRRMGPIKNMTRAVASLMDRFRDQTCADICKIALREKCGTILWRDPTGPIREKGWFADRDIPFDWTFMPNQLLTAASRRGLYFEDEKIKMEEWRKQQTNQS